MLMGGVRGEALLETADVCGFDEEDKILLQAIDVTVSIGNSKIGIFPQFAENGRITPRTYRQRNTSWEWPRSKGRRQRRRRNSRPFSSLERKRCSTSVLEIRIIILRPYLLQTRISRRVFFLKRRKRRIRSSVPFRYPQRIRTPGMCC